jgi:hypothetical protein
MKKYKYLLWMLLLCATPVLAAITKVQSNATWNTSVGSCTVPLTNTVSTHLLAVWATWSPTSLTVSSVIDSATSPPNQFPSAVGPTVQSAASTPFSAQIFYAKNITGVSGTDNVVVTFSGTATTASCVAVEYSGLDIYYPLDSVSAAYSTSGNPTALLGNLGTDGSDPNSSAAKLGERPVCSIFHNMLNAAFDSTGARRARVRVQ